MATQIKAARERGIALVTALLILLLLGSLAVGFALLVVSEQQSNGVDLDHSRTFYAAYGAMEQLNASVGNLFATTLAPTGAQVNALTATPPTIPGINFTDPFTGGSGYEIAFPPDANGNPLAANGVITQGQYQGFIGLITPYTITISGRSANGAEVRLRRNLQTVAIPVFQFGIFSQTDLSFFPGPNFNFGGRVHTNGNLFLAAGATLTLSDKTSAFKDVIRAQLSNGYSGSAYQSNYGGTVNQTTAPGTSNYRALGFTEGSVTGGPGSSANPNWTTLSIGTYNSNIRNGTTGAKNLQLPLVNSGAYGMDLIKLPPANEDTSAPLIYAQRYYTYPTNTNYAMLRILIADTSQEIMALPNVSSTAPYNLACPIPPAGCGAAPGLPIAGVIGAPTLLMPWGYSSGSASNGDWFTTSGQSRVGGYIKIEYQDGGTGNWIDVTTQVLSLGSTGRNISQPVGTCGEPNPNAILRFQRLKDVPSAGGTCGYSPTNGTNATSFTSAPKDYQPNVLFDAREGLLRDTSPGTTTVPLGGLMYYVELDVNNLTRWFMGTIGSKGAPPAGTAGYLVYFSDRRGNRVDTANGNRKLGNLGFEDFVNPNNSNGNPNGVLDTGEDLHGANLTNPGQPAVSLPLETYGNAPGFAPVATSAPYTPATSPSNLIGTAPPGGGIIPSSATRMQTKVTINEARSNPPIFFRRALKLVDARSYSLGSCGIGVPCGLTITAENPVYIQGDFNATGGNFLGTDVPSAVLADAVSLLSNNWNDENSYTSPYDPGGRNASTTWYRLAILAGKGLSFPQPSGTAQDFGTDGGVHNFLRFLENWGAAGSVSCTATNTGSLCYRGSIVSFYYNEQAVGTYKCCTTVYSPPGRGYTFDTNFLTPTLLPPRTPAFRDINTLGFTQLIMPSQQ